MISQTSIDHDPFINNIVLSIFIKKIAHNGWETSENDIINDDWGNYILAGKQTQNEGYLLRRIKPYLLNKTHTIQSAHFLQDQLRKHLIEIHPYTISWDLNHNPKIRFYRPLFSFETSNSTRLKKIRN